jgi:ATP-dependent RNA helicase DeaD
VDEARANAVLDQVRATLKRGDFKRQDQLVERLLEEGFSSVDIASALLHHLQGGDVSKAAREEAPAHPPLRSRDRAAGREETTGDRRPGFRSAPPHPRPPASERIGAGRERRAGPREGLPPRERSPEPRRHEAAVRPPAKPAPSPAAPASQESAPSVPETPRHVETPVRPPHQPKASRGTPEGQTRLFMNVGEAMGISKEDVVETILGMTGLPRKSVGTVDIRERHLFVDVASEHANSILAKLNRTQIKGHNAKVKVA